MTWIQKQTSFRCSLARSFPHKLELLSILISEISDERIGKQEKEWGRAHPHPGHFCPQCGQFQIAFRGVIKAKK